MRLFEVQFPLFKKTGEKSIGPDGHVTEWNETLMQTRGIVRAEDEIEAVQVAKRTFPLGYWAKCYSWIIQEIRNTH